MELREQTGVLEALQQTERKRGAADPPSGNRKARHILVAIVEANRVAFVIEYGAREAMLRDARHTISPLFSCTGGGAILPELAGRRSRTEQRDWLVVAVSSPQIGRGGQDAATCSTAMRSGRRRRDVLVLERRVRAIPRLRRHRSAHYGACSSSLIRKDSGIAPSSAAAGRSRFTA